MVQGCESLRFRFDIQMPVAASKVTRCIRECGGEDRLGREDASTKITQWRDFMSNQSDYEPEMENTILGGIAEKLVELFPTAWTAAITQPGAQSLLEDRLGVFLEELTTKDGQYEGLDVSVLAAILQAKRATAQSPSEAPPTADRDYYGCDLEQPAFWGVKVPAALVVKATEEGYLLPEMGAGYVMIGDVSVAVRGRDMGPYPREDRSTHGAPHVDLEPLDDAGGKEMYLQGKAPAIEVDPMRKFGFASDGVIPEDHQRLAEVVLKKCGRLRLTLQAYVSREVRPLVDQAEFVHLMRLAVMGDAVVERYSKESRTRVELLQDDVLELACAAIGTTIMGRLTSNTEGARGLDAIAGELDAGLLGEKERERAGKLAKERYKLQQYTRGGGRGGLSTGSWSGAKNGGPGKGMHVKGLGKGKGSKGKANIVCDACGVTGHTLRWCPMIQGFLNKTKAADEAATPQ